MEQYEIKPGVGLGSVTFGMSVTEVLAILGDPEEQQLWDEDLYFMYDTPAAVFVFTQGEDLKLSVIQVVPQEGLQIQGRQVPKEVEEILALLESVGTPVLDQGLLEADPSRHGSSEVRSLRFYESKDLTVSVVVTNGDQVSISISLIPRTGADGEALWPPYEEREI